MNLLIVLNHLGLNNNKVQLEVFDICRGNVSPTSITGWQEERAGGPVSVFKKPHKLRFSCNSGTRCCTASHRCVQTPSCLSE